MSTAPVVVPAVASSPTVRVSGTLVKLKESQFVKVVEKYRDKGVIVVHGTVGVFKKKHLYLTAIHGIVFYCETEKPMAISVDVEAEKLYIVRV